jgi:hypothetical protein
MLHARRWDERLAAVTRIPPTPSARSSYPPAMTNYGLVIVGAGSGNMLPTAGLDGLRVAIIERDRFGGTCLNRGCIPSKMLVYAADVAETVRHAGRYGIRAGRRRLAGHPRPRLRAN